MVLLSEVFNVEELEVHISEGHVRRVIHPDGDLALLNYSEKCTYEGAWSPVTRACRGFIYDIKTMEVIARPYEKFWNYGEEHAPDLDLDAPVVVTDKADGSLGVIYRDPNGGYAVATRGSFTSEQAIWATDTLQQYPYFNNHNDGLLRDGYTYLVEIIYPENRIVVNYKDMQALILLGAVEIATGSIESASDLQWYGPRIKEFSCATLREALEMEPRENAEGIVVRFQDGNMTKIKQADYVQIHRLVFGLTARRVWEHAGVHDLNGIGLSPKQIGIALQMDPLEVQGVIDAAPEGNWMDELLMIVPEEFAAWAIRTHDAIIANVDGWEQEVRDAMDRLVNEDGISPLERKDAALLIKEESKELQGALFALLDGKSIRAFAWRVVKPEHETFKAEEGE